MQAILEIEKANQLSIADNLMARKNFKGTPSLAIRTLTF
jgi:hypothetical protein